MDGKCSPKIDSCPKTPEEFQAAVDKYFRECDEGREVQVVRKTGAIPVKRPIPYTMAGLAYALGFACRDQLCQIQKSPEVSRILARAKLRVQEQTVVSGMLGETEPRITGLVMSSDFGYTTRTGLDVKVESLEDALIRLSSGSQIEQIGPGDEVLELPAPGETDE